MDRLDLALYLREFGKQVGHTNLVQEQELVVEMLFFGVRMETLHMKYIMRLLDNIHRQQET